jgi:hypothetical protein
MVISERWSNFLEIVAGSHLYSLRLPRRLSPKSVTFYRIITIKNNHVRSYLVIGWIHIFSHMGFKGSSNFRKFVQMFVAHSGNVCHCEISLEASSVVKFLVAQYRLGLSRRDNLGVWGCIFIYSCIVLCLTDFFWKRLFFTVCEREYMNMQPPPPKYHV